jgi:hypothetical protein
MAENGRRKGDDALLLAGKTIRDAATEARIGERTANRRLADPAFRRRVSELRAEMVAQALGRLAEGMAEVGDKLRELLNAESESVRLGACRALLLAGHFWTGRQAAGIG